MAIARVGLELVRRIRPDGYARHFWRGMVRMRNRPLLWIHGREDRIIPRWWAGLWYESLRPFAPCWEQLCVPGADHAECLQHGGESVERHVARFVELCAMA